MDFKCETSASTRRNPKSVLEMCWDGQLFRRFCHPQGVETQHKPIRLENGPWDSWRILLKFCVSLELLNLLNTISIGIFVTHITYLTFNKTIHISYSIKHIVGICIFNIQIDIKKNMSFFVENTFCRMYTHMHTHTYIFIYLYIHTYTRNVKKSYWKSSSHISKYLSPTINQYHRYMQIYHKLIYHTSVM